MLRGPLRLLFLLLAAPTWLAAQQSSGLVGTWVGKVQGFEVAMRLVLNADGSGDFEGVQGSWRVQGNKLLLSEEGETVAYGFRLQGSQLVLSGGDLMAPLVLARVGGGPAGGRQPGEGSAAGRALGAGGLAGLSQAAGGQHSAPARAPAAHAPSASTRGNRFSHEKTGMSFVVPSAWKVAERPGVLLLGSDTEAGLMIIRFMRRTNLQTLEQGYQEGMQEEGLQLMPATQLENFSAGGAQGLAGELAGMAQDGARIRARAIGVPTPYGDAAVVLGLTTEERYAALKPRVDALAASFFFSHPQTPPVLEAIAGQYFFFTSSSVGGSYSREAKLDLCSDGTFNRGGETYSSGAAGTAAGQSGSGGQWSAQGDESQGVLTLTCDNGETQELEYVVSNDPSDRSGYGPAVSFGGTKYQRTGDGSCR